MAGTWWVEVAGSRVVAGSPQPYVLVITSGAAAPAGAGSLALDRDVYPCDGTAGITLRDADLVGQTTQVTVSSTTDPDGVEVTVSDTGGTGRLTGQVVLGSQLAVLHGDALLAISPDGGTTHATVDCVPPVIGNVAITGLTSKTARLSWTTSEPADTRLGAQVVSWGRTSSHSVPLAPLSPCTAYSPVFSSADGAGNIATGPPAPFETLGEQVRFSDSFESGAPGWQNPDKGGGGNVIQWLLTSSAFASPVRSWTDSVSGNYSNNSSNFLISPPVDLTNAHDAVVRFMHSYAIEEGFDAGYVEYSLNGTDWADPLAKFSGITSGFVPAEVALPPAAAGHPQVWIRFRLTTDNSISFDGWYIDDVVVVARKDCSEVEGLDVELGAVTGQPHLSWLPSPSATSYDVVRGTIPVGGVYGSCLATQVISASYDDLSAAAGVSYFYLVAGVGAAGRGTLGSNSAGLEHPMVPCP